MSEMQPPNYIHYSRLQTISAAEAELLLASFELRDKNTSEPAEYEKLLTKERKAASRVLLKAFESKVLNYDEIGLEEIGPAVRYQEKHKEVGYVFSRIEIQTADFCSWAYKLKYNLPEELLSLIAVPDTRRSTPKKQAEKDSGPKQGGKPSGTLAEAVEHAYRKLLQQKNVTVLKAGELRSFLRCLREMATEGNENQDEYILERIETVKAPNVGPCYVKTKERKVPFPQHNKEMESKTYTANAVSKLLAKLRKAISQPT